MINTSRPMKTVLLDVDGVIADFAGACLTTLRDFGGPALTHAHITQWDLFALMPETHRQQVIAAIKSEWFCAGIPPLEGAAEFVDQLRSMAEVYVVTSPWHTPYWYPERVEWLADLGLTSDRIIFASNKTMIRGDILIEDRFEHVVDWVNQNQNEWGTGILIDRPYNQGDLPTWHGAVRAHSYAEILEFVEGTP